MASQSSPTTQERAQLKKFVDKVRSSRAFIDQIRNDPIAALREAGMSEDMIVEILQEDGYAQLDPKDPKLKPKEKEAAEMAAARACSFTCMCSGCCITPWE